MSLTSVVRCSAIAAALVLLLNGACSAQEAAGTPPTDAAAGSGAVPPAGQPGVVQQPSPAPADNRNWAEKMFSKLSHDFGVVARGAESRYTIVIHNLYKEAVHIQNVSTMCNCASAAVSTNVLGTHQEARLEISMDTERYMRNRDTQVVVTIDQPFPIVVRIPVKVYIRTDVVLTPGSVNFGKVNAGTSAERVVEVTYAGRPDWKITGVNTNNSSLKADCVEKLRANGQVMYELKVALAPDAPAGPIRQYMTLVTDDANSPHVPVLVSGEIERDITAPQLISLGRVQVGESKTTSVVIRGQQPFAINSFECDSDQAAFRFRPSTGTKPIHVIPLTFTAPRKTGPFTETFTVMIAGRAEPITIKAVATIVDDHSAATANN